MDREARILTDAFVKTLFLMLGREDNDDIKKLALDVFSSSNNKRKKAFFDAEQSVMVSCISNEDFNKLTILFNAVSSNDNATIKGCNCIALSNSLIEKKDISVHNKGLSQELGKLLSQEYERSEPSSKEKISQRVENALISIEYNREHESSGKLDNVNMETAGSSISKKNP